MATAQSIGTALHFAMLLVTLAAVWLIVAHAKLSRWYFGLFAIGPALEVVADILAEALSWGFGDPKVLGNDLANLGAGWLTAFFISMSAPSLLTKFVSPIALLLIGLKFRRDATAVSARVGTF